MREVKFRIISNGRIVGFEKIVDGTWQWRAPELDSDNGERWVKGTFPETGATQIREQLTTHRDRKGNETYEGDLLKCVYNGKIYTMGFEEVGFDLIDFDNYGHDQVIAFDQKFFDLVGNIHESSQTP